MKLFALFAAVFAQRAENFRNIVNKIPETFTPTAKTSTFSGAGSVQFTTSSFDKKQENLVLVWSEDGAFSSPFNIIANIRPAHSEFEKFDSEFSEDVSFSFPSDSSVAVSINVDESDSRFFYVLSFSDPFSSSDVTHSVSLLACSEPVVCYNHATRSLIHFLLQLSAMTSPIGLISTLASFELVIWTSTR